jgi:RNase P/RNase MRP subunit p30
MTEDRAHKATANRLAKKFQTEYTPEKGVDITNKRIAIEIESPQTVKDGIQQLQGYKKPVYIAGTNKEAVQKALEVTKGTTVGVMDNQGNILKKSRR